MGYTPLELMRGERGGNREGELHCCFLVVIGVLWVVWGYTCSSVLCDSYHGWGFLGRKAPMTNRVGMCVLVCVVCRCVAKCYQQPCGWPSLQCPLWISESAFSGGENPLICNGIHCCLFIPTPCSDTLAITTAYSYMAVSFPRPPSWVW